MEGGLPAESDGVGSIFGQRQVLDTCQRLWMDAQCMCRGTAGRSVAGDSEGVGVFLSQEERFETVSDLQHSSGQVLIVFTATNWPDVVDAGLFLAQSEVEVR